MSRIRQQNVTAAQWSPNGAALGAADLSQPQNNPFGINVFSVAVQRQRLPKDVFKRLQLTLERGEAIDPTLADIVANAMKDWALENGATHYTHMFQPLTGLTAEKHDSFFNPAGGGTALAEPQSDPRVRRAVRCLRRQHLVCAADAAAHGRIRQHARRLRPRRVVGTA